MSGCLESEEGAAVWRKARNEALEYRIYVDPVPAVIDHMTQAIPYAIWENTKPFRERANISFINSTEASNLHVKLLRDHEFDSPAPANEILVGLGDERCTGTWSPYAAQYIGLMVAHELGHKMSLRHTSTPATIMYPDHDVAYNEDCPLATGNLTIQNGESALVKFQTTSAAEVGIKITAHDYGLIRACVDDMTWAKSCNEPDTVIRQAQDLGPGEHELRLTCEGLDMPEEGYMETECRLAYEAVIRGAGLR